MNGNQEAGNTPFPPGRPRPGRHQIRAPGRKPALSELDAGGALRDVQEAASHAGVCGWPRSRHRTIQETSSGPKLSAKGGGGLRRLITA